MGKCDHEMSSCEGVDMFVLFKLLERQSVRNLWSHCRKNRLLADGVCKSLTFDSRHKPAIYHSTSTI